jgi:hypothetical protein
MAASKGFPSSHDAAELDAETRRALQQFLGNENFEDRVDLQAGTIDRPAFEYLVRRYGQGHP